MRDILFRAKRKDNGAKAKATRQGGRAIKVSQGRKKKK